MKSYEAFIEALKDNADIKRYQQLEKSLIKDDSQNQIDAFPLMREYLYLQSVINDMLKIFTETIETDINDLLKEVSLK
ncbi:MAG: hypothetical protein ACO3MF_00285 [Acholeplasmataceae bacterium]